MRHGLSCVNGPVWPVGAGCYSQAALPMPLSKPLYVSVKSLNWSSFWILYWNEIKCSFIFQIKWLMKRGNSLRLWGIMNAHVKSSRCMRVVAPITQRHSRFSNEVRLIPSGVVFCFHCPSSNMPPFPQQDPAAGASHNMAVCARLHASFWRLPIVL